MKPFEYYTPTKVFFGKDRQQEIGRIIKEFGFRKILLHYGGGSIKKTGSMTPSCAVFGKKASTLSRWAALRRTRN